MISISGKGSFDKTTQFLNRLLNHDSLSGLDSYGELGVRALASATPVETGLTAASWGYRIVKSANRVGIEWFNTNIVNGTPVVILLQYGHGTGTGGYVQGRDFINRTIQPIFDQIAIDVWKKVTA